MVTAKGWILGAGMTGLAASYASRATALEAEARPGGICRSFHLPSPSGNYRFEIGGGHWVFGGDPLLNRFLLGFGTWRRYQRRSAVYFPDSGLSVPYPIQDHLHALGPSLAALCLAEMRRQPHSPPHTMADWLHCHFGPTLTQLFFAPFHELYTAGLWTSIAPQDSFKSPIDLARVERGALAPAAEPTGYNQTFLYPESGLDSFSDALAARANIQTRARVTRIDTTRRLLHLSDGRSLPYHWLLSTLPLDTMLRLTGLAIDHQPGPATAVLVANIGGRRGPRCPTEHWIYVPHSRSGFHRVGFYSNVDQSFLPPDSLDRASLYVERAFRQGARPSESDCAAYAASVGQELREWGFLDSVEVCATNWVETAYTWTMPASRWRESAIARLHELDIHMSGRYGQWKFQGIADSLRDGLLAGGLLSSSGAL